MNPTVTLLMKTALVFTSENLETNGMMHLAISWQSLSVKNPKLGLNLLQTLKSVLLKTRLRELRKLCKVKNQLM
jgi:hypothetical protein